MREQDAFEFSVVERVAGHEPITFDELARLFTAHSWNRVFAATDRLSRDGALAIRCVDRGTYLISLGPRFSTPAQDTRASSRRLSS